MRIPERLQRGIEWPPGASANDRSWPPAARHSLMGSTPFAAVVHSASDIWRSRLLKTTHVMASLAEMERELIVERTRAGLDVARQLGRKGGRKPKMTDSKIESAKKLLASGVPPKDVAKNLGVSVPTLYRWVPASTQV